MNNPKSFMFELQSYCEKCPYFKPDIMKFENNGMEAITKEVTTVIACKRQFLCKHLYDRMKRMKYE